MTAIVWGVAQVKPARDAAEEARRHEIGMARTFVYEAETELRALGLRVFAPKTRERRWRNAPGKRRVLSSAAEYPLFAGYLFVGWMLGSDEWGLASDARGVIDLIRAGNENDRPALVRSAVMNDLIAVGEVIDLTARQAIRPTPFQVGDVVSVNDGPFEGIVGRVRRLDKNKRITALLELSFATGQRVPLRVAVSSLRRAMA